MGDKTYRWLPRQGKPMTLFDTFMQALIKVVAYLPIYIAIVVTVTLMFVVFGVPFVGGTR